MNHAVKCEENFQRSRRAVTAWLERWPRHCEECRGRGCWSSPGSWDAPGDGGPCEGCTEQGICPRCGEPGLTAESRGDSSTGEGPCSACGWDYDDSCPELPDGPCPCELAEMGRAESEYRGDPT